SDLTSVNSRTLTNNGSATFNTGQLGNAVYLVAASTQFLSLGTTDAALRPGSGSFTAQAWADATDTAAFRAVAGIWGGASNKKEWVVRMDGSQKWALAVSTDGSAETSVSDAGTISTGTWYHLIAWKDAGAGTINMQVNNGTVNTAAQSGA